jgi:DNA-binding transcriptional MerR regulator
MGWRWRAVNYIKLIQSQYYDLNNIADLLSKLSSTYKLLVSTAEEYNRIALAKRDNVQDAIDRAEDIGKIMDRLIEALDAETSLYILYARTKNDYIDGNISINEAIRAEVEGHLKNQEDH